MGRFEGPDELAGLLVVSVGRERDVVHRHLELQLLARHGGDLLGLRHDVLQGHTDGQRGVPASRCTNSYVFTKALG